MRVLRLWSNLERTLYKGANVQGLPVIDVAALRNPKTRRATAAAIDTACRDNGFFYIAQHGVSPDLEKRLEALSREFFAKDLGAKMAISMDKAGQAWRGFFPLGAELTSGKPDWKEGIYFGEEHSESHPLAGYPMHGRNLFPDSPGFRDCILDYLKAMTLLSHDLMEGIALALGLPETYFFDHFTREPTLLFRIFHYPPPPEEGQWGVGEHTDYGLLTILKQDDVGGLQVKSKDGWLEAPPLAGTFVCNIGDMLDRLSGGLYRSTPHRVLNSSRRDRYSFPFFFDPGFRAQIKALPLSSEQKAAAVRQGNAERWDKADVQAVTGTYGDYLLAKVGKVFPDLKKGARI